MRRTPCLLAGALLGCAAELSPLEEGPAAVRVAGPWVLPPGTLAIGDRQTVPYTGSPRIADGGRCTSTNAFACSCTHPACSRGLPGTLAFAGFIRRRFPQIRSAGGFDCCRQNTGNTAYLSVHSIGRAIDLSIPTIGGDADNTAGDAVANWLVENAQRIGVQLVVWDRTAWNGSRPAGTKVRPYTGPIPHVDHIHMELSVDGANRRTPFFTSGEINGGGCVARCDGTRLQGADCAITDCSQSGMTCAASPTPRCVSAACPPTGSAWVCLDRTRRAECREGRVVSTGDCGLFGSYCSVAGVAPTAARCVLALCVAGPDVAPAVRTTCSITAGRLFHCDAEGGGREEPCPAGQVCAVTQGSARCVPPFAECPVPPAGAGPDDRLVCLGESQIARCFNGNVFDTQPCGANGVCSTLGGVAHCAQRACLDAMGRLRSGEVCAPGGVVIRCDALGSFASVTPCPEGSSCLAYPDGRAFCGAADGGAPGPMDDDLPPGDRGGGGDGGDGGVPADAAPSDDDGVVGDDSATPGCACRAGLAARCDGSWVILAIAGSLRRRARRGRRDGTGPR